MGYQLKHGKMIYVSDKDFQTDDSQCLIEILYCGICGTDYQKYIGLNNVDYWGHEIVGRIVGTSSQGDIIIIRTSFPCGQCIYCKNGHTQKCRHWARCNINGFSKHIVVNPKCIIHTNETQVDSVFALVEPLYVAQNLIEHLHPTEESVYTIIGNGTIGLLSAFLLRVYYPNVEIRIVGRRNTKKRTSFSNNINAHIISYDDIPVALQGSDKIIITTPYFTIPTILNYTEPYSNITFNGISANTKVTLDMDKWHFRNLAIWPSFPHPQSDFSNELTVLREHRTLMKSLITNVYPLDQIEMAFHNLANSDFDHIKLLIQCTKGE